MCWNSAGISMAPQPIRQPAGAKPVEFFRSIQRKNHIIATSTAAKPFDTCPLTLFYGSHVVQKTFCCTYMYILLHMYKCITGVAKKAPTFEVLWIHICNSIFIKIHNFILNYLLGHTAENRIIWSRIDLNYAILAAACQTQKLGKSIVCPLFSLVNGFNLSFFGWGVYSKNIFQTLSFA